VNAFDSYFLTLINGFAGNSIVLDKVMIGIVKQDLIKGGIIMALFWYFWFRDTSDTTKSCNAREHVLSTIFAALFAVIAAKILALSFPFRLRPLHDEAVTLIMPLDWHRGALEGWSSFPSDHAGLFFALAVGIMFISRRIGVFAIAHTIFAICLPRVFLGLHYPTDILAGAFLGIFFSIVFNQDVFRKHIVIPANWWIRRSAGTFYTFLYVLTFQMAVLFDHIRILADKAFKMVFYIF
jgi:undecaprenyl-diphosphatase